MRMRPPSLRRVTENSPGLSAFGLQPWAMLYNRFAVCQQPRLESDSASRPIATNSSVMLQNPNSVRGSTLKPLLPLFLPVEDLSARSA